MVCWQRQIVFTHIIHHNNTRIGKRKSEAEKSWILNFCRTSQTRCSTCTAGSTARTRYPEPSGLSTKSSLHRSASKKEGTQLHNSHKTNAASISSKYKILHVFCSLHVGREVAHPGVITSAHDQVLNFEVQIQIQIQIQIKLQIQIQIQIQIQMKI